MMSCTVRIRARSAATRLVACVTVAAALAGCGATSSTSTSSGANATTCGTPYTFTVGGQKVLAGSCAGLLPKHPPTVKVRAGERFSVVVVSNANGTRAAPVPKPTGSAVVITQVHGNTVGYQAKTAGLSDLTVRSAQCPTDPKVSTCSVLMVSVG
jgi:hypothetical protein